MASKGAKKTQSSNRAGSATNKEAASIAASVGAADGRKAQRFVIWPEWNDADINGEKWDAAHKGKEKEKGKSPVVQHFFDDPEGKIEMPPSLRVDHWKRPQEFIAEKTPTVVDPDSLTKFDLLTPNEYVHESELMRWITSQISALWQMSKMKIPPEGVDPGVPTEGEYVFMWRPWEHIYAINKITGKTPNMPAYNPHGKYAVKLYWMGCWRKVIIDDTVPFDDDGHMLLPATRLEHELWAILLTKALVKVASLDYNGGSTACEFGDFSVIHCLTGWLPETIPLQAIYRTYNKALAVSYQRSCCCSAPALSPSPSLEDPELTFEQDSCFSSELEDSDRESLWRPSEPDPRSRELYLLESQGCRSQDPVTTGHGEGDEGEDSPRPTGYGHLHEIWKLLQTSLPEWKLPELPAEKKEGDEENKDPNSQDINDDKTDKESTSQKPDQKSKDGKDKGKEKEKGKDDKKDKGKDKKDDKTKEKSVILEDMPIPDHPEIVVFAAYSGPPKYPTRVSLLGEMADASERLRQSGLSHMYPHPVLLKMTRACPLEPPPPPEKVPAWKLIRPKKKKTTPSDEPIEPAKEKPIQCVEITSPFINYKVSAVPIPTDTHRPKSSLERGGTRPPTANVMAIEETDENVTEIEIEAAKEDSQRQDKSQDEAPGQGEKPPTPSKSRKRLSASPNKGNEGEKRSSTPKDRKKSANSRDRVDSRSSADMKGKSAAAAGGASPAAVDGAQPTPTSESAQPPEEGDSSQNEAERSPATPANQAIKVQNIWMDFEDFCKCFKTLYIFHKPHTYPCTTKYSDLKGPPDERTSHYLFVDNLKPTEIVVSFSALCRWNEPPAAPTKEESKLNMKKDKDRDSKAEALTAESVSVIDGAPEPRSQEPVQPGLLVAEPYSWKSLVTGQPILRLRSTASRAAVLSLPAGRHLLRFHMQALLGYHVHFCSTVKFVFGDEDSVMTKLTEESCRFIDNATQVMVGLGKCITNFHDAEPFKMSYDEFCDAHCPYRNDRSMNKTYHFGVFNEALYAQLRKVLAEPQLLTPEMASAWRALFFDGTTKNILGISHGSRPATGVTSDRGSAKGKATNKRREQAEVKAPDVWANREATTEELIAIVKIQKMMRGFLIRKIKAARTPGTDENTRAQEQLQKAWAVLEPQMETVGLAIFRQIFKTNPELMPKYPFYDDEWNKVAFSDHQGAFPDQPPNSWFVVFREVFHVAEEMLCVPKLTYGPGPTCMLRVVNNDTGEEIPRVFQKVAPHVYKRNKRGYTFMAEARTLDQPLQAGRWKMRLIGSLSPLPAPSRPEVNSSFHSRELRDYYVPNDKNIIFRYSVRVTEDHVASLQMTTSKSDVYVKLSILDNDKELMSTVGKGHVVLPAFIFLKDPGTEEEPKRSSSRTSTRGAKRASSKVSVASIEDEERERPHKYIVQAMVLRNSWPISESAWTFVQVLKDLEKSELKVAFKDAAPAEAGGPAPRSEKMTSAASNKGKEKDKGGKGKDKGAKDKNDRGSRPPSQQFDFTKPNWTLRLVSDATAAEEIEVRKDTERADEIRAMKKAWEDAEPGRAAKAMQSRLQYLKAHMVKLQTEEEEEPQDALEVPADGAVSPTLDGLDNEPLLLEPPPPPQPKEILQEIDLTPFIRSKGGRPRLRDEAEIERQLEEKQKEIAEYRAYQEGVEAWREQDRQNRNNAKVRQLEIAELLQASLDSARDTINQPREAFRQRFLQAERRRLEEVASAEAALRADQEKAASPKGRKSPGKKSAGKKKGK